MGYIEEQAESVGSGSSNNGIPFVVVAWDDRTEMEGEIECLEYKVGATVQLWDKRWLETPAVNTDYEGETRHQVFPNLTGSKKEARSVREFCWKRKPQSHTFSTSKPNCFSSAMEWVEWTRIGDISSET